MRVVAILLAAGRGERLGTDRPKAFVQLGRETLLGRAVRAVDDSRVVEGFVIAAPRGMEDEAKRIGTRSEKLVAVVTGGESRQASVGLGIAAIPPPVEVVVCHDVARPFAGPRLFESVVAALKEADGAVPAIRPSDTVKRTKGAWVVETLPRDDLALIQTPQAFRRSSLEEAHARARTEGYVATDDAALLERAGYRIAVVEGDPGNVKITDPADLERANRWMGLDET